MDQKPNNLFKMLLPWMVVFLVMTTAWTFIKPSTSSEVTYEQLYAIIEDKDVKEVVISPSDYVATINGVYEEKGKTYEFISEIPNNEKQVNQIMEKVQEVNKEGKSISLIVQDISGDGIWLSLLVNILPLVLMVFLPFTSALVGI